MYRIELLRPADHPLDPTAIATWGAHLYVSALIEDDEQFQEAIDQVKEGLRTSGEYLRIHGDLSIISARYGYQTGVNEADVTQILQSKVVSNQLTIKVSHLDFGIHDPAEGVRKQLRIVYSYCGQSFPEMVFLEDYPLKLPLASL